MYSAACGPRPASMPVLPPVQRAPLCHTELPSRSSPESILTVVPGCGIAGGTVVTAAVPHVGHMTMSCWVNAADVDDVGSPVTETTLRICATDGSPLLLNATYSVVVAERDSAGA